MGCSVIQAYHAVAERLIQRERLKDNCERFPPDGSTIFIPEVRAQQMAHHIIKRRVAEMARLAERARQA